MYLASDPKAAVQPHEPFGDRFDALPLALLQAEVSQRSARGLDGSRAERRHAATFHRSTREAETQQLETTLSAKTNILPARRWD